MKSRKGVSLVSPHLHMSTEDFIEKLSSVRNHSAIIHVRTDFGPVFPVLAIWDESKERGEEDPCDIGYVTLVYSIQIDDPQCALTMRPYSVKDVLDRLRRVKNGAAVIHTGGTELTPEPISSIEDNTHPLDGQSETGSVFLI